MSKNLEFGISVPSGIKSLWVLEIKRFTASTCAFCTRSFTLFSMPSILVATFSQIERPKWFSEDTTFLSLSVLNLLKSSWEVISSIFAGVTKTLAAITSMLFEILVSFLVNLSNKVMEK